MSKKVATRSIWLGLTALSLTYGSGCAEPEGLMRAIPADVTVKFDFDAKPLPDIPLPNDIATRPDADSRTGKRINASVIAPTELEQQVRGLIDGLDGWGVYQPITIPFTGELDVDSILSRHRDDDYNLSNDAIYLINVDRDSDEFGKIHHLDVGNGNYPLILERPDKYGSNDPRGDSITLPFEETNEDRNGNGVLDPGEDRNHDGVLDPGEDRNGNGILDLPEDIDADGTLDRANYLPGRTPARDDLAGRADAMMTFYERETSTLIVGPMAPLQEETTYAVLVTRRIRDIDGNPVGSPFAYINHTAQTDELEPLMEVLPEGLDAEEIAFAFTYTTESVTADWIAVREGLYGLGPQSHLGENFPAKVSKLFTLKDNAPGTKFEGRSPFIMHHEDWEQVVTLAGSQILGLDLNSQQAASLLDSHKYVDFHAMGLYTSPMLFDRYDEEGNRLHLDLQSWPADLHANQVDARPEEVPFWAVIPRKEVSVRGEGKMAPVVLLGHGYTSNRVGELIGFSGFFAMFGAAVISTDNVSHGLGLNPDETGTLETILAANGLSPGLEALSFVRGGEVDDDGDGVPDRHFQDLDRDGVIDSGVDFWTSYLFHTRDMMRQSALDYMQLVRILRSWDGVKKWEYDINQNGLDDDLAGDFDGDGIVDIGKDSPLYVLGASLGGIMSTTLGAVEPEVDAIVPIAGGGRLLDVGNRSLQGGVPDAVIMPTMGPLFLTTLADDGTAMVHTQVTQLNDLTDYPLKKLVPPTAVHTDGRPGTDVSLQPGDTMIAENMVNGEVRCAYLIPDLEENGVAARARINLESDRGDKVEIRYYRGPVLETGSEHCELISDPGKPILTLDSMDAPLDEEGMPRTFEGVPVPGGPLVALNEGYGLRRNNPELRRFMSLAQMVLDPTDPGVVARHLASQPLTYPNKGDTTGARFLIVTTMGDMNVPASSGVTMARAAGVVDYLRPDDRYGKPVNQVIIDTYTSEAVNTLNRHTYANPPEDPELYGPLGLDATLGVHVDVENFSGGEDIWGDNIPRLDPPLNLIMKQDVEGNDLGGWSGAIFPYAIPSGQHGFALPGQMTDWAIEICLAEGGSPGQCSGQIINGTTYDVGWQMFHVFGRFLLEQSDESPLRGQCWSKESCGVFDETPEARAPETLP